MKKLKHPKLPDTPGQLRAYQIDQMAERLFDLVGKFDDDIKVYVVPSRNTKSIRRTGRVVGPLIDGEGLLTYIPVLWSGHRAPEMVCLDHLELTDSPPIEVDSTVVRVCRKKKDGHDGEEGKAIKEVEVNNAIHWVVEWDEGATVERINEIRVVVPVKKSKRSDDDDD